MSLKREDPPFRCRVCGANRCVRIQVQRPGGNWYQTPFFRCFGCSVMFEDPLDFAGNRRGGGYSGRDIIAGGHGSVRDEGERVIEAAPNPYTDRTQKNSGEK